MSILSDMRVLYHLVASPIRGASHQERLESFYGKQARDYDAFRKRMLHGREELYGALPFPEGGIWADLGGGTGSNLEYAAEAVPRLSKVYVVDLSPSLLTVARERMAARGWNHSEAVEADVTEWAPAEGALDVVTFSYSLTMIPDWFAAVDRAYELLKPGGVIGVVDFFVARKYPEGAFGKHGWFTRTFWPTWFATDNVYLTSDLVPYLHRKFEAVEYSEHRGKVPYMPVKVPYFRFLGRKPG